jgi:hypothetical protein
MNISFPEFQLLEILAIRLTKLWKDGRQDSGEIRDPDRVFPYFSKENH